MLRVNAMHLERQLEAVIHMQFFKHGGQMCSHCSLGDGQLLSNFCIAVADGRKACDFLLPGR